jgi:hypothetical protein
MYVPYKIKIKDLQKILNPLEFLQYLNFLTTFFLYVVVTLAFKKKP